MRSFLRGMKRNPLDHTGDQPGVPPRLVFWLVVVVIAVMGLGAWAQWSVVRERQTDLARSLTARGFGAAQINWIGWCRGAGPRYKWRTAAATGTACVGPVNATTYSPALRP